MDDAHISVRFKHGIHTIYLFVDAQAPFSDVSKELIGLLRERYPDGLTTTVAPPKTTTIPDEPKLAYGVLNIPNDPTKGWKRIKAGEDESSSPSKCGLKTNSIVAFTFLSDDAVEDDVLFEVEWPREDDEMYEQGS